MSASISRVSVFVLVALLAGAVAAGTGIHEAQAQLWSADLDGDSDVDLADFAGFAACFNGPNRPPEQFCAVDADLDGDDDVDLADFATFAACFNGPNRPPACPAVSYALQVTVSGQGSVSLSPDGGVYEGGTTVTLTAEAADGWEFGGWSGDLAGSDNPTAIFVDTPKAVTAHFFPTFGSMVLIPAGEFQMGDTFNAGWPEERPVHAVYVDAFYMDRYEVTKELWDTVRGWGLSNGFDLYVADGKAADHPVHSVAWYDCVKWANARSQSEGRTPCYYTNAGLTTVYKTGCLEPYVKWDANGYRLPTEAEWEKAARGGASGRRFPWSDSDEIQHARANYYSLSSFAYDTSPTRGCHPTFYTGGKPWTSPVGYFAPNGYGLYDMAGNVFEWCNDYWAGTYYSSSPYNNPTGPTSGSGRVLRGGGWEEFAFYCRVAARCYAGPGLRHYGYGFRCAAGT